MSTTHRDGRGSFIEEDPYQQRLVPPDAKQPGQVVSIDEARQKRAARFLGEKPPRRPNR